MNPVKQLHRDAMELRDRAEMAQLGGLSDKAAELLKQAFFREREAAKRLMNTLGAEPSRSVLFRSAAALAKKCGLLREAEQLVCEGLTGNPPHEIAEELRDLFEEINYWRHLTTRGHKLSPSEFQLSLAGAAVGSAMAENYEVLERIERTTTMIYRTAQRTLGDSFTEQIPKSLKKVLEIQMSAPRAAASFAVGFRITHVPAIEQPMLLGMEWPEQVIDEFMTCMALLQNRETSGLKERFEDKKAYLTNFLGLSQLLAPDGKRVKVVGLTAWRNGDKKAVIFDKSADDVQELSESVMPEPQIKPISVQGKLRHADSERAEKQLRITDEKGKKYRVIVKEGLADIVRALFEEDVVVSGDYDSRHKNIINAEIKPA